jgi:hypothetical protein
MPFLPQWNTEPKIVHRRAHATDFDRSYHKNCAVDLLYLQPLLCIGYFLFLPGVVDSFVCEQGGWAGLQLLDSCAGAILNLRSAQVGRERCDETQSAGCDLLGNPHRSCYPAVARSHSNYVLSDSRYVQHRHMHKCFNTTRSCPFARHENL